MKKNNNKKLIILVCTIIICSLSLSSLLFPNSQNTHREGNKKYHLTIVIADGEQREYELQSDEEYLGPALRKENLISGTDYYGNFFVTAVDNIYANSTEKEYWALYKNGELSQTGVDSTPICENDSFRFELKSY